jgi:hypothetical protein
MHGQLMGNDPSVVIETGDEARVTLHLEGVGISEASVRDLILKSVTRKNVEGALAIAFGSDSLICIACVRSISITIPPDSGQKYFLNGIPVDARAPFSLAEARTGIALLEFELDRSSLRKQHLIQTFIARQGEDRILVMADLVELLSSLSTKRQRIEIVRLLEGRVKDPENAVMIRDSFKDDSVLQEEAVQRLGR